MQSSHYRVQGVVTLSCKVCMIVCRVRFPCGFWIRLDNLSIRISLGEQIPRHRPATPFGFTWLRLGGCR